MKEVFELLDKLEEYEVYIDKTKNELEYINYIISELSPTLHIVLLLMMKTWNTSTMAKKRVIKHTTVFLIANNKKKTNSDRNNDNNDGKQKTFSRNLFGLRKIL